MHSHPYVVAVWCCRFTFDHVYDQDSSQQEVYNQSARPLVLSTLQVLGWVIAWYPMQLLQQPASSST
jgi:hypothetical protein